MNRRNWVRNITMAIAASLVPRILQPCVPEVIKEDVEMVEVNFGFRTFVCSADGFKEFDSGKMTGFAMMIPKGVAEKLQ